MKNTNVLSLSLLALMSAPLLSSCGGGGGSSSAPTPAPTPAPAATASAEGFYQGSLSTGLIIDTLILEDGSTDIIYGYSSNGAFDVSGVIMASGSSDLATSTYKASGLDFYASTAGGSYAATISATYVVGKSISGTLTENGSSDPFSGTVGTLATYNYDATPSLTQVTGTWGGSTLNGQTLAFTVNASGGFSGSLSGGCTYTGILAPRASGKNVFDATMTFGAAPCGLPGATVSGIAVEYVLNTSTGARQLLMTWENTAKNTGSLFVATQ